MNKILKVIDLVGQGLTLLLDVIPKFVKLFKKKSDETKI